MKVLKAAQRGMSSHFATKKIKLLTKSAILCEFNCVQIQSELSKR